MTVNRYGSRSRDDRRSAIAEGVMRHFVGGKRVTSIREAKEAARVPVAPKVPVPAKPAPAAAAAAPAAVAAPADGKRALKIDNAMLAAARNLKPAGNRKRTSGAVDLQSSTMFTPWEPPKGVLPPGMTAAKVLEAGGGNAKMAMDYAEGLVPGQVGAVGAWAGDALNVSFAEGIGFLGYSYLAALTQRAEYRRISERLASEMTRKWIKFHTVTVADEFEAPGPEKEPGTPAGAMGVPADPAEAAETTEVDQAEADKARVADSVKRKKALDKSKRIKELEDEMRRLRVKDCFYTIAEGDGWFGRYHLYVDMGVDSATREGRDELVTPIGNGRTATSKGKVNKRRRVKAFRPIEPMWCYPAQYNSLDPLKPDWYNPEMWYVNGVTVHRSRLLRFVGREVPDILKPAYAFGGLSMSQMAKPYVDNWLRTRQAVCDLIESFSVSGVYTNLSGVLEEGNAEAMKRIDMFNIMRSNAGAFVLDKETEEFFNVSTPLGTLDALQAQSQEQMSSVSGIPLIVLLGITPKGLNASSEGELRAFYDTIQAEQERFFRDNLQTVINFIMLSLWGEIDEEITFSFEPLWSMTDKELAETQKVEAETDGMLIDKGIITPAEARVRVANDPQSAYQEIDPADVPEPPQQDMGDEGGDDPFGGGGDDGGDGGGSSGSEADKPIANDEWNEADHPRGQPGNAGQFGPGGGSSKSKPQDAKPNKTSAQTDDLKKVGGKLGSNEGGQYEDAEGNKYYVKKPKTKDHVANEKAAARLYQLAGVQTLDYVDVGPDHVATKWDKLDKSNISKMSTEEKAEAAKDFMVHAWLSNWDAAGTGGDNQGVKNGKPVTLDVGGSLRYRAQGGEKGKAFGHKVSEIETMRDPKMSPDAARLYGKMSDADMRASAERVTSIPDSAIREAAGDEKLADTLIARKKDIAQRYDLKLAQDAVHDDEALMKAALDAVGANLDDGDDGSDVDDQERIDNEEDPGDTLDLATDGTADGEHEVIIRADGDFPWVKLLAHLRRLGAIGASRTIEAYDEEDRPVKFGWDGDGADKIRSVVIDGQKMALDAALAYLDPDPTEVAPDVFAFDEGKFDESKHKRDAGGKFATTGASGGKEGEEAEADKDAGDVPVFKSKKEQIGYMLEKGTTPKELMAAMGWPSVSMPAQAANLGMKLEKKDGKYFGIKMTDAELAEFKAAQAAKKAAKKAAPSEPPSAIEGTPLGETLKKAEAINKEQDKQQSAEKPPAEGAPKKPDQAVLNNLEKPAAGEAPATYPQWLGAVAEAAKGDNPKDVITALFKAYPEFVDEYLKHAKPSQVTKLEAAAPGLFNKSKPKPPAPEASQADKEKAKKGVALKMEYVKANAKPETETYKKKANDLLKEFNDQWAGKENLPNDQLNQKVADYKKLSEDIGKLAVEENKQKAEILKAEQEKAAWEQKQKKEAEEKELAEAFAKDPELKLHHEAMEALFGGGKASDNYLAHAQKKVNAAGLKGKMSAHEAVPIVAYSGSHYAQLNSEIRSGSMSVAQYKFLKSLNAGLDKLPAYEGTTYRKAPSGAVDLKMYQPGKVVEERGFTSSSKNKGTWHGDVQYTIHGKTGRDIQKLSSHPGEAEVLFKSGTRFYVESVQGTHITLREL